MPRLSRNAAGHRPQPARLPGAERRRFEGVILVALEPRIKAAILMGGGLFALDYSPDRYVPERDIISFAPRVHVPVLMQNGRYDFLLPPQMAVEPVFSFLGTPAGNKKLVIYESGHSVWFIGEYRQAIIDFLDEYLGPVDRGAAGPPAGNSSIGCRDRYPRLRNPAGGPKRTGPRGGAPRTRPRRSTGRTEVYDRGEYPPGRISRVKSREP
ncbi:MAG: hypothetical protein MZV64_49920 [Ignavibacteriales bacterium]|nr:hypothetical protein [Ignavibacteriales bacterium]